MASNCSKLSERLQNWWVCGVKIVNIGPLSLCGALQASEHFRGLSWILTLIQSISFLGSFIWCPGSLLPFLLISNLQNFRISFVTVTYDKCFGSLATFLEGGKDLNYTQECSRLISVWWLGYHTCWDQIWVIHMQDKHRNCCTIWISSWNFKIKIRERKKVKVDHIYWDVMK